jgi:hypothetical protein
MILHEKKEKKVKNYFYLDSFLIIFDLKIKLFLFNPNKSNKFLKKINLVIICNHEKKNPLYRFKYCLFERNKRTK